MGPEFDVQPVQLADFEDQNTQAKLFIEYMNLNMILGRIVDCHTQKSELSLEKVQRNLVRNKRYGFLIFDSLANEHSSLPAALDSQPTRRATSLPRY